MLRMRADRTLVVAATPEEAAHLPEGVALVVTGIGKTLAAVATTQALMARRDAVDLVVNLGTAGALRDGLTGIFEPRTVLNHDLAADAIRALGHDPHERLVLDRHGADAAPAESEGESEDVVLATGDVFVSDPAVRARLARVAHLVDMEGYAVAWACRQVGVPVRMIKHVSDNADAGALDWPALVDASARALGERLAALLE